MPISDATNGWYPTTSCNQYCKKNGNANVKTQLYSTQNFPRIKLAIQKQLGAPIGALKCNFPDFLGYYDWPTN